MIIEFSNDRWHEVIDSLARRWIATGKAVLTRREKVVNGRHREYLQYIRLTGNRGWTWATREIDEDRFTRNKLAGLR